MTTPKGTASKRRSRPKPESSQSLQAKKASFLEAIRSAGSITGAVEATSTNWQTHRDWLTMDAAYAAAFEAVKQNVDEELTDALQSALVRRALVGVEEPVFYRGEQVGVVRKPSEHALVVLWKVQQLKTLGHQANINAAIKKCLAEVDPSTLSNDEFRTVQRLLHKAAGLEDPTEPIK